EAALAGIWRDVLGRERVGATDNFFDLGGHSLLATRVISRLRTALGVEIPLRELFERPTVRGLAERVEAARGTGGAAPETAIGRAPRDGELPLSFAQARLWFLDRLAPGSAAYNMPVFVRLRGDLSVPALAASLAAIVARHEVLRTRFEQVGGEAVQRIAPASAASRIAVLREIDLAALAPEDRALEALRLEGAEARLPFDLEHGPVLRAALLRLGAGDHVALFSLHHIASDGWSGGILVREIGAFYRAAVTGVSSGLAPLPIQYADYAVWQRRRLGRSEIESELAWWRQSLVGVPALELPGDRPRPPVLSGRGAALSRFIPAARLDGFADLSRGEEATPFMLLFAGLVGLLGRVSGQDDFAVGTPVANRDRAELEGLIGFFVNSLALRLDLAGDPSFRALVARSRRAVLETFAHQELPFERVVEELQPARDLSRSPLFQVFVQVDEAPEGGLALPGLSLEPVGAQGGTAKFDLLLELGRSESGLACHFEYATDLFDPATVARLAERFARMLEAGLAEPDRRVSTLPIASAAESHQVLVEWNGQEAPYDVEVCLHRLVEAQADRTPGALAIVSDEGDLTYADLEQRANRLARYLGSQGASPGIGRGARVAILLERGPEMVVAILAVLKAGAAYVPLDPGYPAERLAFMLGDAAVAGIVTDGRLAASLASPAS